MIKYFDSVDLAIIGKTFVKEDLIKNYFKTQKINPKKYHFIFIDDKLGLLKVGNKFKKNKINATNFWINRENYPRYNKKYYDYEIKSLNKVIDLIKKNKKTKYMIITDFDNTLCKANYEATKRNNKEKNFWDKMPKNIIHHLLTLVLSPFTYFTIIIDLFKNSNVPFKETKKFKEFIIKNNIETMVISYRNKILQKKYF